MVVKKSGSKENICALLDLLGGSMIKGLGRRRHERGLVSWDLATSLYTKDELSFAEIGRKLGSRARTIREGLLELGVKLRKRVRTPRTKTGQGLHRIWTLLPRLFPQELPVGHLQGENSSRVRGETVAEETRDPGPRGREVPPKSIGNVGAPTRLITAFERPMESRTGLVTDVARSCSPRSEIDSPEGFLPKKQSDRDLTSSNFNEIRDGTPVYFRGATTTSCSKPMR